MKRDSEGGVEATNSNKCYWNTAISLALAAASTRTHPDAGRHVPGRERRAA